MAQKKTFRIAVVYTETTLGFIDIDAKDRKEAEQKAMDKIGYDGLDALEGQKSEYSYIFTSVD